MARRRGRSAPGSRLQWAPELVEQLLADCAAGADALPLLSLTLARLYEDYGGGVVGLAEYAAMGGMRRVVQTEIDAVLSPIPTPAAANWRRCTTRSSRGWPPSTPPTISRCGGPPASSTCPPTATS